MKREKLLILGAGGHGRVVADIARSMPQYGEIAFADDALREVMAESAIICGCEQAIEYIDDYDMFVAIGNSDVRKRFIDKIEAAGGEIATLIHPAAAISPSAKIGPGVAIMPGGIVNAGAEIGKGVIINTAASVDHDCIVEEYCHIAVGAHLCGNVHIGAKTWIGAGSTIINGVEIAANCTIGAGAVVIKRIEQTGTYVGVPAHVVGGSK